MQAEPSPKTLFSHRVHPHQPVDINAVHKKEVGKSSFNTKIAVALTHSVGTMYTAYSFALLAVVGLLAIIGILPPLVAVLVVWFSQTFLQLVFLPILSVGQTVLSRHSELQADELFNTSQKSFYDIEQIIHHLEAQDAELLKQTDMLVRLMEALSNAKTVDS